jgi:hypothetical protein
MRLRTKTRKRGGAYTVEAAFVFPITFFLILAIIIGSLGIFKYQECSYLARMATRYGSTHGDTYWYYYKKLRPPASTPGVASSPSSYTDTSTNTTYLVYQPTNTSIGPSTTYTNWSDDIYGNRVFPNLMLLDHNYITCQLAWPTVAYNPSMADNAPGSQIRCLISYQWFPAFSIWLPGLGTVNYQGVTFQSQSSMPITY